MPYSKLNFISPINVGDKVIRIKNTTGLVLHLIKETTATTYSKGNYIILKQSGEANSITLDFSSETEAIEALVLLRQALTTISLNTGINMFGNTGSGQGNNSSNSTEILEIGINGPNTILGIDFIFNVPVNITKIIGLYVNGQLIDNNIILYYTYTPSINPPTNITWKATAEFALSNTDIITIQYSN